MYEWERNQLRASGFCYQWTFISLCVKEKMRRRGIKTIPITGRYDPPKEKPRRPKTDGDDDMLQDK